MAQQRHLTKAPVTEAVIDFQCRTTAKMTSELVKQLHQETKYRGRHEEMRNVQVSVAAVVGKIPTTRMDDLGLLGGRFFSDENKFVVQMRSNGMTFSRLPPYTEWDSVFAEVSRLWEIQRAFLNVEEVSRIAVRFINRLVYPQAAFS